MLRPRACSYDRALHMPLALSICQYSSQIIYLNPQDLGRRGAQIDLLELNPHDARRLHFFQRLEDAFHHAPAHRITNMIPYIV